jgi:aspartyl-tRNA(Asn)/glutamyl-tRNA(Gln) amidotransferase subunit A
LTGLVGLKATFARVPVWPASSAPMLAHVGPMTRSVADAILLLRVIAGPDRRDPFSLQPPLGVEPDAQSVRSLRVAFSPTLGFAELEPSVGLVVTAAVGKLRSIFPRLEEVSEVCADPSEFHRAIFLGGISARLGDLVTTSPELIDPPLVALVRRFREMTVDAYTRLLRRQVEFRETLRLFFERYDLLLTPTMPCAAWDAEQMLPPSYENVLYFTRPFNQTGQPAASIPCGLTVDKLPVGIQVTAALGEDARLLAALRVIEAAFGTRLTSPVKIQGSDRKI